MKIKAIHMKVPPHRSDLWFGIKRPCNRNFSLSAIIGRHVFEIWVLRGCVCGGGGCGCGEVSET